MAEGLTFDDLNPAWKPPRPGEPGAPTVPISKPQASDYTLAPPKVPISKPQASDYEGLTFDDLVPPTDAQKSVARIRDIAKNKLANQPYTPGPLDLIADAGTYSLSRPVSALAGTAYDKIAGTYPDASANEIYQANIAYMNDRARQAEKNTPFAPVVGAVAQLPVTMATGGGSGFAGVGKAAAPATTLGVAGRAAAQGAVEGAAQHADTPWNALKGATANALLSGGVAGGLDLTMKAAMPAARRGAAAEADASKGMNPLHLEDNASAFYKDMDKAGVRYDASQTAPLYAAMHDMRNASRYSDEGTPELKGYFNKLMSLSRNEMSYTELQNLRSAIADKTRIADPATRKAAGELIGHIDRVIRDVPAINPSGIDMKQAHSEASRLWRSSNVASDLDLKAGKAERMVDAGKNINPDAKLRDDLFNYRERILNKKNYSPLDDTQKALLDRALEGSTGQNLKREAGDFLVKHGRGMGALAGAGTTAVGLTHGNAPGYALLSSLAGLPVWGVAHASGKALQNSAAGARRQDVGALLRDITNSSPPVPGAAIDRNDLAKILFAQDLERMAPRVGSQEIGNPKKKEEEKK